MKISLRKLNCICLIISIILGMTVEIKYLDAISFPGKLASYLITIFCIVGIFLEWRLRSPKKFVRCFLFLTVYLLLYIVATRYAVESYLRTFAFFILLFFVYCYFLIGNNNFHVLMDSFVQVVLVICCATVFFWFFGSVLGLIPPKTETYTWAHRTSTTYNYFYLYFENPGQNQHLLGMTLPRNCGIFTEAPAYSGILLYAIGIELFAKDTINRKRLVILLLAVLTVQSTKAFVILIILFGLQFMTKEVKNRSRVYLVFRSIAIAVMVAAVCFALSYILEDKSTTGSYAARMNHLTSGIRTWLQHPLFGAGFRNAEAYIENQESGYGYKGASMGLTLLLAYGGLYLLAFYVFAYFYALRHPAIQKSKKGYNYFALILLMNLFFSNSAFGYPYKFMISAAYAAGAQAIRGHKRWRDFYGK